MVGTSTGDGMRIGTKSVLFGAHAFWLHPFFVAYAWWKLYGFPTQLWLWVAFFVHDLGYWGKPNMDGDEGEKHPLLGANIMYNLEYYIVKFLKWQGVSARITGRWGNEALYHSRFWAKKNGFVPSDLCWADKLAFTLEPWWFYWLRTKLSGELKEYRHRWLNSARYHDKALDAILIPATTDKQLILQMQDYCKSVVKEKRHAPA
jgi:hypothetical protein